MKDEQTIILDFLSYLVDSGYEMAIQGGAAGEDGATPYLVFTLDKLKEELVRGYMEHREPKVRVFTSSEELVDYMEKVRAERVILNDHVKPWQAELKEGDCFIYHSYDLKIWCKVRTSPYPEDQEIYRERPELILAECFSEACSEGELGNIHRATITQKITPAEFDLACKIFKDGPCHGSA